MLHCVWKKAAAEANYTVERSCNKQGTRVFVQRTGFQDLGVIHLSKHKINKDLSECRV